MTCPHCKRDLTDAEVLRLNQQRVGKRGGRPRKLTVQERREIRRLRKRGWTVVRLAMKYGVSVATINRL